MDLLLNRPQILGPIVAGESKSLPALDGTDDVDVIRHYLQLLRMCKNCITKLAPNFDLLAKTKQKKSTTLFTLHLNVTSFNKSFGVSIVVNFLHSHTDMLPCQILNLFEPQSSPISAIWYGVNVNIYLPPFLMAKQTKLHYRFIYCYLYANFILQ